MTEEINRNRSIHPRVVKGRTVHPKVDTSRQKKKATLRRAIAAIERHLEQHPRDDISARHLAKLKAALPSAVEPKPAPVATKAAA